jgi:phospholipid transport system substrate-binding protein
MNFLKALFLFCLLTLPTRTLAVPTVQPSEQVRKVIGEVEAAVKANNGNLEDPNLDKQLKDMLRPMFNFDEMSRRCLGQYWKKATPAEQTEFVELFSELLARTYLNRIKKNVETSQIKSLKEEIDGDKALVKSRMIVAGDEIGIDYRMLSSTDDRWKVYDIVVENVGLVTNYRNEFPEIIKKDGFPGLLKKLKEKQGVGK